MRPTDRDEAEIAGLPLGSVWGWYIEHLRIPIIVPRQYRLEFEDEFRQRILRSERRYNLSRRAERHEVLRLFADEVERELARLVDVVTANSSRRPSRGKLPTKQDDELAEKARERNARLLEFGAERIVSVARLRGRKSFAAADKLNPEDRLKPGRLGCEAVPWDRLLAEWRRAYPNYRILSPTALKVDYYKAARNTHLAREFLREFDRDFDEEWKPWEELRQANARLRAGLTDAERTKRKADEEAFMAKLPADLERSSREWLASPEGRAAEELRQELVRRRQEHHAYLDSLSPERREAYEERQHLREETERQQFRDSLTRRELIEKRVFLLLRLEKDELSEHDRQLQEAPLRDWFLIEARGGRGSFWGPWGRRLWSRQQQEPVPDRGEPRPPRKSAPPPQPEAKTRTTGRASRTSRRPR